MTPTAPTTLNIDRSRLLPEQQFINTPTDKSKICLHFTAGPSAASAIDWWAKTPEAVATPYVVDADGRIFEIFDPRCWAWHLGAGRVIEQQSIGIEIANWGPLTLRGETLFTHTGKPHCRLAATDAYRFVATPFRGYNYFASFPAVQMTAVGRLVRHLCARFSVPFELPPSDRIAKHDPGWVASWRGVFSHQNVRADKCDVGPAFDWSRL